mgnify:CR=1 FL=1
MTDDMSNAVNYKYLRTSEKQRLNNFKKIRIGTWNVRSLYEEGRTHNAIKEMRTTNVDSRSE